MLINASYANLLKRQWSKYILIYFWVIFFCKYAEGQFVNIYYKSIKKEISNMFISLDTVVLL